MTGTNKKLIIELVCLICLVIGANVYFLYYMNVEPEPQPVSSQRALEHSIRQKARHLKPAYLNRNPRFYMFRNKLLHNFKPAPYENASILWEIADWWPVENQIYPRYDSAMGQLLTSLRVEPISKVTEMPYGKGTQLKLYLHFRGGRKVIFKPQWYKRDEVLEGDIYYGKDRHNAEVYAFFLGAVLDLRWTPIVVGRIINMKKDVYEKGDSHMRKSVKIQRDNTTEQYCVAGNCFFCKDFVCADKQHHIEGAVIFIVPGSLNRRRSPWMRNYKGKPVSWETDMNYCKPLKGKLTTERLLDLTDVAIFDFLMQNGDRHTYEMREHRVVLVDNGKSFGNPYKDFIDILAPLYQCCMLRKSTWERLKMLSGGVLTELIDRLSKHDVLYPLISEKHREGVERRLLIVYAAVEYCLDKYGEQMLKTL